MSDEDPKSVPPMDEEVAEEWVRETSEPDVRAVSATRWRERDDWPWQVTIGAAEFVREEPLESEMRAAIDAALRAVPGVKDVAEDDREVWVVAGDATGEALVRAAGAVVDRLQGAIRKHIASL